MNVLSLFDGISGGQIALERANIKINKYYASEINQDCIKITQHNYPKTIQLGNIKNINSSELPKIDLLIGGSPCQGFSCLGKLLNFKDKNSILFYEFLRLFKELKPTYFLLENIKMKQDYKNMISEYLEIKPIEINSSLVSAQNRIRLYWTNIPLINGLPKDKQIKLLNILSKSHKQITLVPFVKKKLNLIIKKYGYIPTMFNPYNLSEIIIKSPCLTSQGNSQTKSSSVILYKNNKYFMLNCLEWERLQTLKDNYTRFNGISESKRKNLIGNGWTIDIISHIFKNLS